jgi:glycine cleavage system aminomethyltransferase T
MNGENGWTIAVPPEQVAAALVKLRDQDGGVDPAI